ncbi:hypothetical protein ACFX13_036160 [Malus domestica]
MHEPCSTTQKEGWLLVILRPSSYEQIHDQKSDRRAPRPSPALPSQKSEPKSIEIQEGKCVRFRARKRRERRCLCT